MDPEPPLPRPTIVAGSRSSSRASSRGRSIASSGLTSRSASPAQPPDAIARDPSAGPSSRPLFRAGRSASRDAVASSSNTGTMHMSAAHTHTRHAADASNLIVISSDSSEEGDDDDDEDDDGFVAQWPTNPVIRPPPTDFFEVAGVRRAQLSPSIPRDGLFSPPPLPGRPANALLAGGSTVRRAGVSADPRTGDFLTRPMSIVRPADSVAYSDPDGSFTLVSAQTAPPPPPPPRSDHPITDQRLRSSNLAMPTKSPPRSKPPPIEHPLLSTYTCPICFDAPTNLCVTPCGHFFCGECLFQALKTQAVQRGAMEEEASLFHFGGLFSSFVPAAAFGAASGAGGPLNPAVPGHGNGAGPAGSSPGAGHGRGGGGAGGSRGGGTSGGRGRSKPDPLAGQCPVCRAKIKGAFNGREKNGIVGLRLTMGKPVNDPRQDNGQMKTNRAAEIAEASSGSESDDEEETVLPTSKKLEAVTDGSFDQIDAAADSPRAARRRQRSVNNNASASMTGQSPTTPGIGSQTKKRRRNASDISAV